MGAGAVAGADWAELTDARHRRFADDDGIAHAKLGPGTPVSSPQHKAPNKKRPQPQPSPAPMTAAHDASPLLRARRGAAAAAGPPP